MGLRSKRLLKRRQRIPAVEKRHLSAKAFIAEITANMENDWQVTVRKHAQAHWRVDINSSCHSSQRFEPLQEVGQVSAKLLNEEIRKSE
jgi:hypothetical protein